MPAIQGNVIFKSFSKRERHLEKSRVRAVLNKIESGVFDERRDKMFPLIDKKKTGINLRLLMDERGLTVKDIQQYLKLGSVQSVYHWLNGISLPTVDNLYALSYLFQVPVDGMLCGSRPRLLAGDKQEQIKRLYVYYEKLNEIRAA